MTRICIYGAGAIGGHLAANLARAGDTDISVVVRGRALDAIRSRGLTIETSEGAFNTQVAATDDAASLGPQDYVILTLKAPAVAAAVPGIATLVGQDTTIVTAMNGIPYWYFYKHGGAWDGHQLSCADPGAHQWESLGAERAIGAVVWTAAAVTAPGIVRHTFGNRFDLGEPDGSTSPRAAKLSDILTGAGLQAPIAANIRSTIWNKLWGNLSFNPVSALTLTVLDAMASSPRTTSVLRAMMIEAQCIGEKLGVAFPMNVDERIALAKNVGAHKTSMLQDLEAARPLEIDALTGVIAELGRLVGVTTPTVDAVLALVHQRARNT
jgi:2-dehydropantoate 2-reductase